MQDLFNGYDENQQSEINSFIYEKLKEFFQYIERGCITAEEAEQIKQFKEWKL